MPIGRFYNMDEAIQDLKSGIYIIDGKKIILN